MQNSVNNSKNKHIKLEKIKIKPEFPVNIQITPSKVSLVSEIHKCYRNEGLSGFYKGMSFPLCSVPFVNAVVFAVHELTKKFFNLHDESHMSLSEGVLCGAIAGLVNCIVVTPVELVKCRLQIQLDNINNSYYKGVYDCMNKIFKQEGIRGLYSGGIATIYREVPAYAAQFGGYYYSKKIFSKLSGKNVNELANSHVMVCGAIGGYSCWQFSYPQDVVKTLLQVRKDRNNKKSIDGGFIDCAKLIYKEQGISGFWRGFSACTIRALLSNSVLFLSYETSKNYLKKLYKC
jgi:solute carrier family 25 carnitine/acylcarnitine transporter 20/29